MVLTTFTASVPRGEVSGRRRTASGSRNQSSKGIRTRNAESLSTALMAILGILIVAQQHR
jgi:hypothetical protein